MSNLLKHSFMFLAIGLLIIKFGVNKLNISGDEQKKLLYLFCGAYFGIIVLGTTNYHLANKKYKQNKKNKGELPFLDFINNGKMDSDFKKRIMVGIGTGIVFGILDNTGLWFGMDALDPILPKGELTQAGYGNVFSDSLSAFVSTFAGNIIANLTKVSGDTPIWANAVGTFLDV